MDPVRFLSVVSLVALPAVVVGGFFLHLLLGAPGRASAGTALSTAGAVLLARLSGGPDHEAALAGERRAAVRAALARLPDRAQLLLMLRFYHQLSYAEIGQRTGQDTNTVGVQLLRARRRLRDELRRGGSPDG